MKIFEYAIVGAGPAGICAAAKILGSGVLAEQIIWIDPAFRVGEFGGKLSMGSSVPGNTTVASYQAVNQAIYELLPICRPPSEVMAQLRINTLSAHETCSLKIAAHPLQMISDCLVQLVKSIHGQVINIQETQKGFELAIQLQTEKLYQAQAKRVILATGAEPKTLHLPCSISTIDPLVVFIESELKRYLNINPEIRQVAVIGSSHSAALAVMHLLKAGIEVKQFMNKDYLFAAPAIAQDGTHYVQFDNTGLKGEVAAFTRQLLIDTKNKTGQYKGRWSYLVDPHIHASLETHLAPYPYAVVCIGYQAVASLTINGRSISAFAVDKHSSAMRETNDRIVPGLFGIGIAYPLAVKAISGEIEPAVGVAKFWNSINNNMLHCWEKGSAAALLCQAAIAAIG